MQVVLCMKFPTKIQIIALQRTFYQYLNQFYSSMLSLLSGQNSLHMNNQRLAVSQSPSPQGPMQQPQNSQATPQINLQLQPLNASSDYSNHSNAADSSLPPQKKFRVSANNQQEESNWS